MNSINLLPWREQRRRRYPLYGMGTSLFLLCLISIVIFRFNLVSRATILENDIRQLSKTTLQNPGVLFLQKAAASRQLMWTNGKAIVKSVPTRCYLTQLSQDHGRWHIEGTAYSAHETQSFMEHLKKQTDSTT